MLQDQKDCILNNFDGHVSLALKSNLAMPYSIFKALEALRQSEVFSNLELFHLRADLLILSFSRSLHLYQRIFWP